jgi:hypothetical protein
MRIMAHVSHNQGNEEDYRKKLDLVKGSPAP